MREQTVNEAELARHCGGLIEAGQTHFGAAESWGLVFFWLFPEVQQPSCESWELACPILPRKSYLAPPQRRSKASLPDRESENQLPSFPPSLSPRLSVSPLLPALFPPSSLLPCLGVSIQTLGARRLSKSSRPDGKGLGSVPAAR